MRQGMRLIAQVIGIVTICDDNASRIAYSYPDANIYCSCRKSNLPALVAEVRG
jgi:hypothetical protein